MSYDDDAVGFDGDSDLDEPLIPLDGDTTEDLGLEEDPDKDH